jgi:hypothetical protein
MTRIIKITVFLLIIFLSYSAISQTNEELVFQKINYITRKEKISHQVFEKVLPGVDFFHVKGTNSKGSNQLETLQIYNCDTICYKWQINILTKELGSRSNFTENDLIKLYLFLNHYHLSLSYNCSNINLDSINISKKLIYTSQDSAVYNKFNYKATFTFRGKIKQCLFYIRNKQIYRKIELHPTGKMINREEVDIVNNFRSKSNFILNVNALPINGYPRYRTII